MFPILDKRGIFDILLTISYVKEIISSIRIERIKKEGGMHTLRKGYFLLTLSFILLISFTLPGIALGESDTICVHGNSARVENENLLNFFKPKYYGWGLDFNLYSGQSTWVHFSIPVHGSMRKAFLIALNFETGSSDAIVDRIDVWSANNKVTQFDVPNTWGYQNLILTLGTISDPIDFESLGISVHVKVGYKTQMSHNFKFYKACAGYTSVSTD
jgi:hypothetical protein